MVDIVDKALRMGEGHQLKKLENVAKAVNALEDEISALSDEEDAYKRQARPRGHQHAT